MNSHGVVNFRVGSGFQNVSVLWDIGLLWEIPGPICPSTLETNFDLLKFVYVEQDSFDLVQHSFRHNRLYQHVLNFVLTCEHGAVSIGRCRCKYST